MNRTQKVVLIIIAITVVCMVCGVVGYIGYFLLFNTSSSEVNREPSREEWALAPRGDGKYRIGNQREMALGRWYTDSNKYGCIWSRGNTFGSQWLIVEKGSSKTVMLTGQAEYFKSEGCGTWYHQYGK